MLSCSPGDSNVLGVAVAPKQEGAEGAAEVVSHQLPGREGVPLGGGTVDPLHDRRSGRRVD